MKKYLVILSILFCLPGFATTTYDDYEPDEPTYVDNTGIEWAKFVPAYYGLNPDFKSNETGLNPGDWRAFSLDETEVFGTSTCNNYDEVQTFMPAAEKRGQHCWCKIIAATRDVKKNTPSKWIYRGEFQNISECSRLCTYRCVYNFLDEPEFRGEIFNK